MAKPKFEVYEDVAGKYRWRLKSSNGQKIASAARALKARANAKRAAETVKATAPDADVED